MDQQLLVEGTIFKKDRHHPFTRFKFPAWSNLGRIEHYSRLFSILCLSTQKCWGGVTAAVVTRKYDDSIDGRETLRLIYSQLRRAKEILGDSRNPLGILIERCGLSLPSVYSTLPNEAKIDYAQNRSQSHLQVHD